MRLGYHMSTVGGYKKQIPLAKEIGAETIQVFIGSPTSWRLSALNSAALAKSGQLATEAGITPILVHTAYLINMASKDDENYVKSHELLAETLRRASILGATYVVTHIGSHSGAGLDSGLDRVAGMLEELSDEWPSNVTLLLENTAGSGNSIGDTFAEIGRILRRAGNPERLGVCLDTCHAWSAGYRLCSETDWQETLKAFEAEIDLRALKFLHLNDTQMELGSKRDRHANIGEGQIGLEGFRAMFMQPQLQNLPGVLETPDDGSGAAYARDLVVLKRLRDEAKGVV